MGLLVYESFQRSDLTSFSFFKNSQDAINQHKTVDGFIYGHYSGEFSVFQGVIILVRKEGLP